MHSINFNVWPVKKDEILRCRPHGSVDNDRYYLSIGRDAASTIENLSVNEEVIKWIQETELQTNNEECKFIVSYSITNEEMLNYLFGYKNSSHKSEKY